ncbi:NAD(P)/FAD-dependent oxidoreductase [Psychroserpens sp.]|uniref:NAD(P)/FAD-dependent oxidoreductase n=1 Tax=Psychroserpens sp. TaxID=2020870 RepID=UPI001B0A7F1E|nr:NAD(P)/FAD-dependent oxidoreductase [Psychroserpens sp.]MBO6605756.1 NAD(P)/FAD-dependent oxidoreductase [Psychroserpens sp.]MBO6630126.1 NAD(P)/FAD-dependent oxidoreductase [Psychroserpens sp.]MBO6652873.1 NAD(P)/FAD-dependent oxidoreductase [Psychroserpens sp.]MBO6681355.1 NAD(P)/FAD-dependent oxidoreductase [Psychroserpens sp.]MBO6749130.1 NAD(P)/FAD-dependent oxidoreductase [Psychroserpens sp.]
MKRYDTIIVGGGAAGFFAAINIAEMDPNHSVAILERGKTGLQKVKISGGGRCNVTHAEFIPSDLVLNYPRGEKELLGPFHQFMTGDTIEWFEKRGITLKVEDDGRMFPTTDSSQTIIDCFLHEADSHGVDVFYNHALRALKKEGAEWLLQTTQEDFIAKQVVITTGSNPKIWKLMNTLGHTIVDPVPSLFTFDIIDDRITSIPGVVAKDVEVKVLGTELWSEGPLLITHVGMSAPAILKLSAFGALELAKLNYNFDIEINFIRVSYQDCLDQLKAFKLLMAKKTVWASSQYDLPKRLWQQLLLAASILKDTRWADLTKSQTESFAKQLTQARFEVTGKSTFKEEFVTAGGIDLKEVNFKRFESKLSKDLYFAGEILNIDAVTGGFNFQNAWTGAYIVAKTITSSL